MGSKDFDKNRKRNASGESTSSTDSVTAYIPTPPDGGWGWVVVFASFINHVIVDGVAFTFGIFYMEFMKYFESSKSETALVGSLLAGFYLMAGPIASAMVNKFGCRIVCITGSILSSVSFVLCTLSPNIHVMMLTYGCMGGFGFGLIYLPSIVSVSYYFEKKRALATGIAVCGAGVGCFIFAPAGRYLMVHYSWKSSMYIVAGVTLNSCICGMLMRPLEAPSKRPRKKNFFDRLREKFVRSNPSLSSVEEIAEEEPEAEMLEKVQEAKLAREQALYDAESEYVESNMGSAPSSRRNSSRYLDTQGRNSRTGSLNTCHLSPGHLPQIIVEDITEAGDTDTEKTKMINKLNAIENETNNDVAKPNGHVYGNGNGVTSNMEKALLLANTDDLNQNGLLLGAKPEDQKVKSLSTANVWGLAPRKRSMPPGVTKEDYARPMYRRDIFYSGSIIHITEFRSQPNVKQYVASITTIPTEAPPEKESKCWKSVPVPKAAKDVLKQMLDLSLLKDPVFLISCFGEIFGFIGLFVPFVFVAERAIKLGIPDTEAAFLLSVIGITNTIGRVLAGWLADFPRVNSLLLHNLMMILGGVACILNMFATNYISMCVFCAFFGLCVATYISLTSIILCDIMGLERLTSAFGMLTLVRGLSSIAGPPIAGLVFDLTDNYDMSFHVGGIMFIIAGCLYCILHLPCFGIASRIIKNNAQTVVIPPEETVTVAATNESAAAPHPVSEFDLSTQQKQKSHSIV